MVANPVARIFAELATPGRRDFLGVVRELTGGGGGGRSGSFIISHRLRLRSGRHRRRDHARGGRHRRRHRRHRRNEVAGALVVVSH